MYNDSSGTQLLFYTSEAVVLMERNEMNAADVLLYHGIFHCT